VESPEKFGDTSLEEQSTGGSPFMDFVDSVTKTVKELVNKITHFFQDMLRNAEKPGLERPRLRRPPPLGRWL
jgi:hypothetical protein